MSTSSCARPTRASNPVRPVLAANVRPPERDVDVPLIADPLTARVTDLFNVGYEILLEIFERFFAHTEETDAQLKTLADTTIGLMFRVIKPLGDLITTLPVGDAYPGMTAGPSFELFYESDYLMPHREAAWALLAERLDEAAWLCDQLASGRGQAIAGQLEPVLTAMRELSQALAAHLPAGSAHARLASPSARLEAAERDVLLRRARDMAASVAARAPGELAGELAGVFDMTHAIVAWAASGLACAPEDQALIVPRLVDSVLGRGRMPAEAATAARAGRTVAARVRRGLPVALPRTEAEARRGQLWELQSGASGHGPGRTKRPVPDHQRAPADRPSGCEDPARAPAGALPLRQLSDQAAVRRQPRTDRLQ